MTDVPKILNVFKQIAFFLVFRLMGSACTATAIPQPSHTSPLSPQAEEAPYSPVATSLIQDPLAIQTSDASSPEPQLQNNQQLDAGVSQGHNHHVHTH